MAPPSTAGPHQRQRDAPERRQAADAEAAGGLLERGVGAAQRRGDRQVDERVGAERHHDRRAQQRREPRRERVPRVADDEVGDRHRQHQQDSPQRAARAARSARSATRHRSRSSAAQQRHDHAQHDGVAQQHHRPLAEQHAVNLAPAGAARRRARSAPAARAAPRRDQHARDRPPASRGRIGGGAGPASGWLGCVIDRRLRGSRSARPAGAGRWASVPVPICAGVIGLGSNLPNGGSAGFGATPVAERILEARRCRPARAGPPRWS